MYKIILMSLLSLSAFAQFSYDTAQTLPSLKRKTILTKHFRIIYPNDLSNKAKIVASSLERAFEPLQDSLLIDSEFDRIDIILQNQSAQSNGYVALAPFRSEWETLPYMNNSLGSTNWLITLAIHEQRHMHQFLKYRKGFAKGMYYLFGDFGKQISIALSAPRWLLEGDAVVEETLFTKSGRGRVADFSKQFRALMGEGELPDYDRVFYGSYETLMPGAYPLGYYLNLNLRLTTEKGGFNFVIDNMVTHSWFPYKLEQNIEYVTGKKINSFYKESVQNGLGQYEGRAKKYKFLDPKAKNFSSKLSVNSYNNKFIYYRSGFYETGGFFKSDKSFKNEEVIIRTNAPRLNRFKVVEDLFAYSDITVHPRYSLVNYSNIYIYDLKKDEKIQVTNDGQYFLPEIFKNKQKLAAVYFNKKMNQFLKVMNFKGEVLKKIQLKKNITLKTLSWLNKKELLVSGIDERGFQFISIFNTLNDGSKLLFQTDKGVINDLVVIDERILLSSDIEGIDQVYILEGGELKRVTDAQVAARYPNFIDNSVYFSNYAARGFRLSKTKLKEITSAQKITHSIDKLKKASTPVLSVPKTENFKEDSYDKKDFRVHSWSYVTSILSQYNGVASITSSDNLNQLSLTTGFINNYKEGATSYYLNANYQKYWPIFHLNTEVGKRSVVVVDEEERDQYDSVKWDQDSVELGITLPFTSLLDAKRYSLRLTNALTYDKIDNKSYPDDEFSGELKGSLHQISFRYNWLKPYSRIFPKYLFTIDSEFRESQTISGLTSNAYLKYLGTNIALPGGFDSASFLLKYDHQEKSVDRFNFEDRSFFARGYDSFTFKRTDSASLNYAVSLFYPDYNFFDVLFFKRIRANLFHDYTVGEKDFIFRSTGIETIFDITPLRFSGVELGVGLRAAYLDRNEETELAIFLETISGVF